jgi:ATP-dependent exoDNAse (exonuclease V) alpha subunit
MLTEQNLERNFCPYCYMKFSPTPIKCPSCDTEDLIPSPANTQIETINTNFTEEEIREIEGEHLGLKPPTSKLELDQNAVDALLNKKFGFLTGLAGTGKTTLINEIKRLYPRRFELCATTGIAAVNLGSKTLHSTLKFFDVKSLENAWREGLLHMNLRKVRAHYDILGIDEASMLGAEMLDFIVNAIDDINNDNTGKELGLWLFGDLCQLPPINMKYIFHSDYWERFEQNTVRLTKVWRQDNKEFMDAINLIRANKGIAAMQLMQKCGVKFTSAVDDKFEGTTLIPNNNDVDSYNDKRLQDVPGNLIRNVNIPKGVKDNSWDKLIPTELRTKIGAYVMILSNDIQEWRYVNGDCGYIRAYDPIEEIFDIELKRTGDTVKIRRIKRENFSSKEPEKWQSTPTFQPYHDHQSGDWVIGVINYHPIRLAYASTIHKSQGLSLDMVQIDSRPKFFSYGSMGYVSISRARTPEGLVLVGDPVNIGRKISMNKEVMRYV